MLGTTVGQYRITGVIGRGGMGAVYRGEHTLLDRPAAIKLLLPELSRDQDMVTRFFNEARAAASIRHPGIVEIYDFGRHVDGSAYIAMEHLQGESLASRMTRGRMTAAAVTTIARQIAGALAAAHGKGIVHRDLKPENVFLVPDMEVIGGERIKLLDFGIAKLCGEGSERRTTRTGMILGTPTYMAPEQCRGVAVDHRADLYSLGCIMFEACTSQPPFAGEGVGDVLAAHIHIPPPIVSSLVADLPAELVTVIEHLLTKDRDHRTQSARAVAVALDAISGFTYSSREIVVAPHAEATSRGPLNTTLRAVDDRRPGPGFVRQRRVLAGLAIAVVILIGVWIRESGNSGSEVAARLPLQAPSAQPTRPATPPTRSATPPQIAALPVAADQRPGATTSAGTTSAPRSIDSSMSETAPRQPVMQPSAVARPPAASPYKPAPIPIAPAASIAATPLPLTPTSIAQLYMAVGQHRVARTVRCPTFHVQHVALSGVCASKWRATPRGVWFDRRFDWASYDGPGGLNDALWAEVKIWEV